MSDCIFCKIVAGDITSTKVYEDEHVVAFRDINPQAPIHIVIIPRRHMVSLNELGAEDDKIVGHLVRNAANIAKKENIAQSGYRLVANCGPSAGQTVAHLHFHLLGGRDLHWPPG